MKIELIRASQLDGDLREQWSRIQQNNSDLDSAFLSVEFTEAVASVRGDVWVGVFEQAGQPVGFFPFHRRAFGIGKPVGERLSDRHGLIAPKDLVWSVDELLRGCRLKAFDFDHLPACQEPLARFARNFTDAPFIELSQGFEAYARDELGRPREVFKRLATLARKLTREIGPLHFQSHCTDPHRLRELVAWKSGKYPGSADVFSRNSSSGALLERILASATPALTGQLSSLCAGDVMIAAHLGLRSMTTFQYWIPAYDVRFARYSPGLLLLVELLKSVAQTGIRRVNLGHGGEDYKRRFMSDSTKLGRGTVTISAVLRAARKVRQYAAANVAPLRPAWRYAKQIWQGG